MNSHRERERVDLFAFKLKMKAILKDNADTYWAYLKKFSQARLTKRELDTYARGLLLTEENIALHNLFIKSIINNALCPFGPVLTENQKKTLQNTLNKKLAPSLTAKLQEQQRQQQQQKRIVAQTRARAQPQSVFSNQSLKESPSSTVFSPLTSLQPSQFLLNNTETYALRTRMYKIATELGINHITNQTVTLMMKAVETHIRQILEHMCNNKRRLHPPNPTISKPDSDSAMEESNNKPIRVLTAEDLYLTVEAKPYLLGEDVSINLERIQDQIL